MPSIKQLKLGGLAIPSTDLDQHSADFRDNRNVLQDADGEYHTRNGDSEYVDGNGDKLNDIEPGVYSCAKAIPYVADEVGEDAVLFMESINQTVMPQFNSFAYFFKFSVSTTALGIFILNPV